MLPSTTAEGFFPASDGGAAGSSVSLAPAVPLVPPSRVPSRSLARASDAAFLPLSRMSSAGSASHGSSRSHGSPLLGPVSGRGSPSFGAAGRGAKPSRHMHSLSALGPGALEAIHNGAGDGAVDGGDADGTQDASQHDFTFDEVKRFWLGLDSSRPRGGGEAKR